MRGKKKKTRITSGLCIRNLAAALTSLSSLHVGGREIEVDGNLGDSDLVRTELVSAHFACISYNFEMLTKSSPPDNLTGSCIPVV